MYQPPRGTRDFLPNDMMKRNWVFDIIRETYETYGFEPLGTPAFESWELLKEKSGDEVINQIYYFKDKADRELGLRFEWTTSLARVVATHRELSMPFKRYAIGPVWRYENPSEKRFREFWQADADIVGVKDPIADAEVLAAAVDCLNKLGFDGFVIKINDRRILEGLIKFAGISINQVSEIIRTVDKLEKIGRDGVIEELSSYSVEKKSAIRLLDLLCANGTPKEILTEANKRLTNNDAAGVKGCQTLMAICEYAEAFGYFKYLVVDLSLARGLDYYTGPVFEVSAKGHEDYGSIAGGGRYDEIIGLFGGEPTPATGISLGIERIVPLLESKGEFDKIELGVDVLVAATSNKLTNDAISVSQDIREAGIPTIVDLLTRRLSKQLEYAAKKGINRVVIIGEKELTEENVTVRDMSTGEQVKIKRKELINFLRN
jgi:histidyl-tRNA synthetase